MASTRQPRTFISYSRVNQEFAVKLARELKAAGYSVWLDQLDIPAGVRWDDEIERVLRECRIFVAILTPAFIESENAKDEIGYAIDHEKRILPVLLEKCDIPLRLSRFQYVDFTRMNYREGVTRAKELLAALEREEAAGAPARDSISAKSRERPTQPSKARVGQGKSKSRKVVPTGAAARAGTLKPGRQITLYMGIAAVALMILLGVGGYFFGLFAPAGQTPTITPSARIVPTGTPRPTATAVPDTPTPGPQGFFTEEFDTADPAWRFYPIDGGANDFIRKTENGKLVVHVAQKSGKPRGYLIHEAFSYTDVRVEAVVTNTGNNANGISLICNFSTAGWYEFRISSGGTYAIYAFGPDGESPQGGFELKTGGSTAIETGKETNVIGITCTPRELALTINGNLEATTPPRYNFPAGNIGIGFSSPSNLPVDLEFESVNVSRP